MPTDPNEKPTGKLNFIPILIIAFLVVVGAVAYFLLQSTTIPQSPQEPGNKQSSEKINTSPVTETVRLCSGGGDEKIYKSLEEALKNPEKTCHLDLSGKKIATYPAEIVKLTNLRTLNLSSNHIVDIPPSIGQLKYLETLDLHTNLITKLPKEIGLLTKLQTFSLLGNKLTQLPPNVGNLKNLQWLELSNNQLTKLPSEMKQLTKLQNIFFNLNKFSPEEVDTIKELFPNLKIEYLSK